MNSDHKQPPEKNEEPPTSPLVEAMRTLSYVTTAISLMLISGGLGYLLDQWLNITLFVLLGFALGGFAGISYLIRMTGE